MKLPQASIIALVSVLSSLLTYELTKDISTSMNNIVPEAKQSTLKSVVEAGKLRCGYISYPPFFEIDPNTSEPKGVMVDIMAAIGKKMDVSIEWTEETGWGTMIEGLKNNRYDAVCSSVWKNTARVMHSNFSDPIGYSVVNAWARPDGLKDISHVNSPDVNISVIDGEMSERLAKSFFPKANTISLPQSAPYSDVLLNVANGKADVVFVEEKVALDFLKSNPGSLKKITVEKPISVFPISVVIKKNADELTKVINAALEEIASTPELEAILLNYDSGLFKKPNSNFY